MQKNKHAKSANNVEFVKVELDTDIKIVPLKCPQCGASIELNISRKTSFCSYCGTQVFFDDGSRTIYYNEKKEVTQNINHTKRIVDDAEIIKAKTDAKEKKNGWIALIVCLVICLGIPFGMFIKFEIEETIAESKGKVSVGYYKDYEGKNYEAVVKQLEALGFENIETIDLNDSGFMLWKNENVDSISIGGDPTFESVDYFSTDEKVIITYH